MGKPLLKKNGFIFPNQSKILEFSLESVNPGKSYKEYKADYRRSLKKTESQRKLIMDNARATIARLHKWRKKNGIEFFDNYC
jgi:hypothetical protein